MSNLKQHGINISLSTVATLVPVLAFLWLFIQPALVKAVADDLDKMIETKQQPMQSAFKVLVKADIDKLKKAIARAEVHEGDEDWSEEDAIYLADLKIELEALQEAYSEL
jgi:phage terminase Nu1 subunit (DNA packaging protein)